MEHLIDEDSCSTSDADEDGYEEDEDDEDEDDEEQDGSGTAAGHEWKVVNLRKSDIGGCRGCRNRRTCSALRKPRRGQRMVVLWEDRNHSFSGTVGAMIKEAKCQFEIKYDDRYKIVEHLDNVHW